MSRKNDKWANHKTCRLLSISSLSASLMATATGVYAQSVDTQGVDAQGTEEMTLEEVVVIGIRQQLLEAAAIERASDTVTSVITADDVGQFPDQNIAEALQRVPGVTITRSEGEGRYVSVRGLDKSFVQVTVNNASIGSSEGSGPSLPPSGDRSVALDVIPADLLSKVEVGKTLLPDTDHSSLGAKVDLRPLSAFDRSDNLTGKILIQGTRTEYAGETKPKLAGDWTYRKDTDHGEFGVAAAVNYFERAVQLDRLQSDSSGGLESVDGILVPREFDQRFETGQRDRIGGTITLDYRTDLSEYNFSVLYGKLKDDDIRIHQEIELRDSSGAEREIAGPGQGLFSDVDIERQAFYQPREEQTYAIHFEGKNDVSEQWRVAYAVDFSKNEFTLENGLRGRFRERDSIVSASWGEDSAQWTYLGRGDFDNDRGDRNFVPGPEDFNFDDLLIIDESREDEIFAYNIDLERSFQLYGNEARIQFGLKQTKRKREFLRGENEVDIDDFFGQPGADFLPQTLADIATFRPDSGLPIDGGIPGGALWANIEDLRNVLTRAANFTGLQAVNSRRDFTVDEDIDAGYLMIDYDINDKLSIIAGVRVEKTSYQTTGDVARNVSLQVGDDLPQNVTLGVGGIGKQTFKKEYTEVLPSIHFRYDVSEDVVARVSLSKGQVRPGFGAATALQRISFDLAPNGDANCEVGDQVITLTIDGVATDVCVLDASLTGGNPDLEPLTATQFDFNVGWYPSDSASATVAIFYKDLENIFVGTNSGGGLVNVTTGIVYNDVSGTVNGEKGSLMGIEIAFNYFFDQFDGWFSHVFAAGNLSLIDGEVSDPGLRDGKTFRLPGQSDIVANLSIGYEDEAFLLRLSANYRGDQLSSINTGSSRLGNEDLSVKDLYRDDFTTIDLTLRYNINDRYQIYTDVSNITESTEDRYFQGDENGRVFERSEDFGRTFTFGFISKF